MKTENLEQYLGKEVTITFNDNVVKSGILHREEDFPNDPNKLRDGGYLLRPCYVYPYYNHHFRKSHIKKNRKVCDVMKIILNKEEINILKNYLGVNSDIKYINFETSHIFIGELSHILTEYFDKIHNSYRIAYKLDTKRKELTFYNDFPKYDREFQKKVMFSKIQ